MGAPFCAASTILAYSENMLKIAMLTIDAQRARQVQEIFPEWEMHMVQLASPEDVLKSSEGCWTALVVDLDAVEPHSSNAVEFLQAAMTRATHAVVLVPARLMHLEPQFAEVGAFVLRKPTSSGEIALALRMLLRPSE